MSTYLSLLIEELERNPRQRAQVAQMLQPHLVPTEDNGVPGLLTADQAAARLQVSRRGLVRAAAAGRVPGAERVGRSWRFHADQLALLPSAGTPPAPAPPPSSAVRAAGSTSYTALGWLTRLASSAGRSSGATSGRLGACLVGAIARQDFNHRRVKFASTGEVVP